MKVLIIFAVRLCEGDDKEYDDTSTQLTQFSGDRTVFFTKLLPQGIQLKKGELFWFPDGENPFFPDTTLRDGFHDYYVKESGLLYYDGVPRPYFLILETDCKSEYEEIRDPEDDDWKTHVEETIKRHRKSFAKLGWKFEEDLPQQKSKPKNPNPSDSSSP